jgi:hypothetical protein
VRVRERTRGGDRDAANLVARDALNRHDEEGHEVEAPAVAPTRGQELLKEAVVAQRVDRGDGVVVLVAVLRVHLEEVGVLEQHFRHRQRVAPQLLQHHAVEVGQHLHVAKLRTRAIANARVS